LTTSIAISRRIAKHLAGTLRWTPATDGKTDAVTGDIIRLPASGTLYVCQVVQGQERVKDVMGYVVPADVKSTE
jgi:hypothetical protein